MNDTLTVTAQDIFELFSANPKADDGAAYGQRTTYAVIAVFRNGGTQTTLPIASSIPTIEAARFLRDSVVARLDVVDGSCLILCEAWGPASVVQVG